MEPIPKKTVNGNHLSPLHQMLLRICPSPADRDGSIKQLSVQIGVSYQAIYKWIWNNKIPAKWVKHLVLIAEGRVTQEEILTYVL